MSKTVLVAGASGALGRRVLRRLADQGHRLVALEHEAPLPELLAASVFRVHRADALESDALAGACEGVDIVFSCLGASVSPRKSSRREAFHEVDWPANRNLLAEAKKAGVERFVYVSVGGVEELEGLDYLDAHARVVDELRHSGLDFAVVRPVGFFSAFEELLRMGSQGYLPIFGDGSARTNPIHEADLAKICGDTLLEGQGEIEVGGPEILTRLEIAEMALEALGKKPRVLRVPAFVGRLAAMGLRAVDPRRAALTEFYAAVSTRDVLAPAHGSRRLADHFAERVRAGIGRRD